MFRYSCKVLVVLCVSLSACWGQEADVKSSKTCDLISENNKYTANCSRREFDSITEKWPDQLYDLKQETSLVINLSNNVIKNITELPTLKNAEIALILKSNGIVEIEDDAFKNLVGLKFLDLSHNKITGKILRSEIFQGYYENGTYNDIGLTALDLSYNEIHTLDRYLFKHTPNLRRLFLNNNPIEMIDVVTGLALSSAVHLEILDLGSTDIDNIPYDAVRGLINLREIDLSNNRFKTIPDSLKIIGATLTSLTFNNNPIVELNDDSFVGLENLKFLEVGHNNYLEEVKRSTFTPLKKLKTLHLCHNKNLRYISHNAFRELKYRWTIEEVYLDENNLSELSTDLMPWSKLRVIGMTGNNWLCNCDLANIVISQGAGNKFKTGEIPFCAAPMKFSGTHVTKITLSYCPTFDSTSGKKKGFKMSDMKPKHVLWSILGVAAVVLIGMLIGLFVNTIKSFFAKLKSQPIRYANLNEDSNYA